MINYSVRKRISRALSRAGIPEPLKFFLFGVSRRRRHSQRENLQCKDSLTAVNNTDESDIAIAIDRWASINSNIIRGICATYLSTFDIIFLFSNKVNAFALIRLQIITENVVI